MAGILSYGSYIPLQRLGPGTRGWTMPTEKSVANWDEDALTLAVAAAANCLGNTDRQAIDGLYFASTTAPYKEKLSAVTAAWATDLQPDILTADFGDTLRAGTTALRAALDSAQAGSAKEILVMAADMRFAAPRSGHDNGLGDGAAAFIVGNGDAIATLEGSYSLANELLDVWRADGAKYLHTWEDRFVYDEGYLKIMPLAVNNFLEKYHLAQKDITKVVFGAPDTRRHREVSARMGFQISQIQPHLLDKVGDTGAAFSLMLLTSALEESAPGDRIMVASYGDGVDVLLFRTTDRIRQFRPERSMKSQLDTKRIIPTYDDYLAYRQFASPGAESPFGSSASVIHRERDALYRLHGVKCLNCGTVQYPPQRVCTVCHAKDSFAVERFAGKKGKVFTFTLKNGGDIPPFARPMPDVMIDFAGGGRAIFGMTDCDTKDVAIGMDVEMTFRRLSSGGGMHNYFWRCMPPRKNWLPK